jgi:lipid-binding SYLF domain-containing protein
MLRHWERYATNHTRKRGNTKGVAMNRTRIFGMSMSIALLFACASALAQDGTTTKAQQKKQNIDKMAEETLNRLFATDPKAKTVFDLAYGYAVFTNVKVMFGISGAGGSGVAVVKNTGQRVYMKVGSGGIGIGLGGQKSSIVFLFEDRKTLENFIYNGWQGDAAANAVAGTEGANASTTFTRGVAAYQMTESGLMLKADVSGTKFWVDKKLNKVTPNQTSSTPSSTQQPAVVNITSEPLEPGQ